ncbi:MAG: hypothetical protein KGI35_12465, partial [Burkholderiales bacterium]|nr:hypothetical protein [Burkholderiales bacterium]
RATDSRAGGSLASRRPGAPPLPWAATAASVWKIRRETGRANSRGSHAAQVGRARRIFEGKAIGGGSAGAGAALLQLEGGYQFAYRYPAARSR